MKPSSESKRPGVLPQQWDISKWPWWAIVLALGGLGIISLIFTSQSYNETFLYLTTGIYTTLRITLFSFVIATILGLLAGLARVSKNVLSIILRRSMSRLCAVYRSLSCFYTLPLPFSLSWWRE